jgi:peptidoglycan/xylan/chitin deacetylase (PgdA/CDA1 family)
MKEFGWNMTLWAIAKAMERNPEFAKACVREGHEIGAHGKLHISHASLFLHESRTHTRKDFAGSNSGTTI